MTSVRVAIVVGAGGELGRATAEKLAAAGFTAVGVDRSEEGPEGAARRHPEAVADIIVYLVSDAATLVSGAVVPAYGA